MSFFKKILFSKPGLWCTGYLARFLLSLLYRTLRVKFTGGHLLSSKQILALWHDKLLLVPLIRKISPVSAALVVSNSRDGKLLGALINTYKDAEPIYVAHNKRHAALSAMKRAHDEGKTIIITPDGPRGPRHTVKPGLFYIRDKTGAEIISMTWDASSSWTLNTWDKMEIPKPFATVTIHFDKK